MVGNYKFSRLQKTINLELLSTFLQRFKDDFEIDQIDQNFNQQKSKNNKSKKANAKTFSFGGLFLLLKENTNIFV